MDPVRRRRRKSARRRSRRRPRPSRRRKRERHGFDARALGAFQQVQRLRHPVLRPSPTRVLVLPLQREPGVVRDVLVRRTCIRERSRGRHEGSPPRSRSSHCCIGVRCVCHRGTSDEGCVGARRDLPASGPSPKSAGRARSPESTAAGTPVGRGGGTASREPPAPSPSDASRPSRNEIRLGGHLEPRGGDEPRVARHRGTTRQGLACLSISGVTRCVSDASSERKKGRVRGNAVARVPGTARTLRIRFGGTGTRLTSFF